MLSQPRLMRLRIVSCLVAATHLVLPLGVEAHEALRPVRRAEHRQMEPQRTPDHWRSRVVQLQARFREASPTDSRLVQGLAEVVAELHSDPIRGPAHEAIDRAVMMAIRDTDTAIAVVVDLGNHLWYPQELRRDMLAHLIERLVVQQVGFVTSEEHVTIEFPLLFAHALSGSASRANLSTMVPTVIGEAMALDGYDTSDYTVTLLHEGQKAIPPSGVWTYPTRGYAVQLTFQPRPAMVQAVRQLQSVETSLLHSL